MPPPSTMPSYWASFRIREDADAKTVRAMLHYTFCEIGRDVFAETTSFYAFKSALAPLDVGEALLGIIDARIDVLIFGVVGTNRAFSLGKLDEAHALIQHFAVADVRTLLAQRQRRREIAAALRVA